jgi:hypothetical protein
MTHRRYTWPVLGACVVAFGFGLWNARHQWFIFDEWAYWTQRRRFLEEGSYADFFLEPHLEHLHMIVMAVWLPLDRIFGATTYVPYVIPTLLVHCVAGYLLFLLLRRAGIRPGIAAGSAVLYLFLENAAGNVSFGWQIVFVAPIALCYLALLAVERAADGGSRKYAVLAISSLVIAVVSSGVAITVVAITAIAAAAHRRFRLAAAIVVVPGAVYLLWRRLYEPPTGDVQLSRVDDYLAYVKDGLSATLQDVVQIHFAPVSLLLFVGAVLAVVAGVVRRDRAWPVFAAPLVGGVLFYLLLATQRSDTDTWGSGFEASAPRYVHVASAFLLPALAYGVERLVSLRRWAAIPIVLIAVWALLANAYRFPRFNDDHVATSSRARDEVSATVAMGDATEAVSPFALPWAPEVLLPIGTLRHLADRDKLPCSTDHATVTRVAEKLDIAAPAPAEVTCAAN